MEPGPRQDHKTNPRAAQLSDRFDSAVIPAPPPNPKTVSKKGQKV